jgi:hypothetical protein
MKLITSVILISILFVSCTQDEEVLNNEYLLFSNSYPISVPPYEYRNESDELINVWGDSSYQSSLIDTLSPAPVLSWGTEGIRIITVAISNNLLKTNGNKIDSLSVVWQWHSGMGSEKNDTIQYSEGKNVINGTLIDGTPNPLEPGHYYWAIWGWGQSGTQIMYSSRELEFYVVN